MGNPVRFNGVQHAVNIKHRDINMGCTDRCQPTAGAAVGQMKHRPGVQIEAFGSRFGHFRHDQIIVPKRAVRQHYPFGKTRRAARIVEPCKVLAEAHGVIA